MLTADLQSADFLIQQFQCVKHNLRLSLPPKKQSVPPKVFTTLQFKQTLPPSLYLSVEV